MELIHWILSYFDSIPKSTWFVCGIGLGYLFSDVLSALIQRIINAILFILGYAVLLMLSCVVAILQKRSMR